MNLSWVYVALDYVENTNISALLDARADQDVLGLEQPSHHVQNCRFSYARILFIYHKRGVAGH